MIEQPQLEAIASQFGVDWQPLGSRQSVTLERPGRLIGKDFVIAKLAAALTTRSGARFQISISDFSQTMIDRDAAVALDSVSVDGGGFLTAELTAVADGTETLRTAIEGRVDRIVALPVPNHPIPPGKVLDRQDLTLMNFPASRALGEVLARSEDGLGLVSGRLLPAGLPIQRTYLHRPDLVSRDGPVMIELNANGVAVDAQGRALESGSIDDQIRVLNPVSRAILLAVVTGRNQVRVELGSTPLLTSQVAYPNTYATRLDDEAPHLAESVLPRDIGP